ncbi:MAG: OsmC family protein [Bacteroidota bacterium]
MTTASIASAHYRVTLQDGRHELIADEPMTIGGTDAGPAPDELLEASLASCTAITLRMYADHKQWPVAEINVTVDVERVDGKTVFTRAITVNGSIDETQRNRLLEIAQSCPISKSLLGEIVINSKIL